MRIIYVYVYVYTYVYLTSQPSFLMAVLMGVFFDLASCNSRNQPSRRWTFQLNEEDLPTQVSSGLWWNNFN